MLNVNRIAAGLVAGLLTGLIGTLAGVLPLPVAAQAMESAEPFKVGTFEIDGAPTAGLVLRDEWVVDIAAANADLELDPAYVHLAMPRDMLELIGQYEYGLKYRLYDIVNRLVAGGLLDPQRRPGYVRAVETTRILPPIQYPSKIMNAAVNFYTHACEGCSEEELARMTRERQQNRGVPYLFLKPTRGAIIGTGDDTFAPQGPWIVPKEFYGDPMQRLHQQLTIDGVTVQEAKAGDMIHSLWELIEYASSLITLYPGDVLNSGTSGGTAAGAFETGSRSGYLEPGEEIRATIEGIGTLRHRVVAGEAPPADLSGAELPPVASYRRGN